MLKAKKHLIISIVLLLVLIAAAPLQAACVHADTVPVSMEIAARAAKPKKITITGSKYVAKGKKITLKATVSPAKADQKVIWSTSNKKIATVSKKGVVTGKKAGKVTITATSAKNKKVKKTFKITVMPKPVSSVSITGAQDMDMSTVKKITLTAKAKPAKKAAQSFEWKSSDPKIATVSKKGVVKAVAPGTVKITATATDGSKKKKSVKIRVLPPNSEVMEEPGSMEELAASVSELISQYDGNITPAEGCSEYELGRLVVSVNGILPDVMNYHPVKVLVYEEGIYILQFERQADAKACADYLHKKSNVNEVDADHRIVIDDMAAGKTVKASGNISWGASAIHADLYAADLKARGIGRAVTVAVVDSGVDVSHPLIRSSLPGIDFVDEDRTPQDEYGHGTHVAGIIMDCTRGTNVRILPVRVVKTQSGGSQITVSLGIKYAAQSGADVINISLEMSHNMLIDSACQYAINRGCVVVVAAGNRGTNASSTCPAHFSGCITVSSIDSNLQKAKKSNNGSVIDLAAPGVDITSSLPGNRYATCGGTSMAAPHVAAAAALLLSEYPDMSPSFVTKVLKEAAKDLGKKGTDEDFGAGMVDLQAFVQGNGSTPDPENPSPDPENPSPDPENPSPDPENPDPDPENPDPDPENPNPDPENPDPVVPDGIRINDQNFTDLNFRMYVKGAFDTDQNGYLSDTEIAAAKSIDIAGDGANWIYSLKGVEYLKNLESISIVNDGLADMDLSCNTALTSLNCEGNTLETLNLSNNTKLASLNCSKNKLVSLELTKCEKLVHLDFASNQLTAVDLSQNSSLEYLDCSDNDLSGLALGQCKKLAKLYCHNNKLTALDISHNTVLTEIKCHFNKITALDISACEYLTLEGAKRTVKQVTVFVSYDEITCPGGSITLDTCVVVTEDETVLCSPIPIDEEHFPDPIFRERVRRYDGYSHEWWDKEDYDGYLTAYEISRVECICLDDDDGYYDDNGEYCTNSQIKSVEGIEYFTSLKELTLVGFGSLEVLPLSGNSSLESVDICDTSMETIVFSSMPNLTRLNVLRNEKMTSLALKNCGSLETATIQDNTLLVSLELGGVPLLKKLDCNKNALTKMTFADSSALEELYCEDNQLASLDLGVCSQLKSLYCDNNQLVSLNISACPVLETLHCTYNQLQSLDISNNTLMTVIWCDHNNLSALDIREITYLNTRDSYGGQTLSEEDGHRWVKWFASGDDHRNLVTVDWDVIVINTADFPIWWFDYQDPNNW